MDGIYELDENGNIKLTAEAQQWLQDGKLKLLKQDVFDENSTGIVVDMIFMGYEPCPEVQAILAARELTPAPEYSWELSYDHAKGETCGYLKDYAALEEAIIKGAGIPAEVIQGSDSASNYAGCLISDSWFLKTVYGKEVRYPPGQSNVGMTETPVMMDNAIIAKQMADHNENGVVVQMDGSATYLKATELPPDEPFIVGG